MILATSYSKEWIYSIRSKKGYEKIDAGLAEKMIHALALVEALSASGLDFVFKGGTALILLMDAPGRFSIDIDIITTATQETIETALKTLCTGTPFRGYTLNEKRSYQPGIPKAHYELQYVSSITGKDAHILLDILFDEHSYPTLVERTVTTEWLQTDEKPILVRIPTHESITGDKLTAFAPNTTGIRYRKGKELEIVKQLFDLGGLYPKVTEMAIVRESFDKTVAKEIAYRGNACSREDVLDDIIQTGLLIARRERNKEEPHAANFAEIRLGLLQFRAYQMAAPFRIDEAILASAKAALMAAKIKIGSNGQNETFPPEGKKSDYLIAHSDCVFLNKLPPEPLFYWRKTYDLLGLNNPSNE